MGCIWLIVPETFLYVLILSQISILAVPLGKSEDETFFAGELLRGFFFFFFACLAHATSPV